MALIRIEERTGRRDNSNAVVSFDNGPVYSITINDPYTEKEEKELEWYFEEHLEFPFTKKVRAQKLLPASRPMVKRFSTRSSAILISMPSIEPC